MRKLTVLPAVLAMLLACAGCTVSTSNLSHNVDVLMGNSDCTGFVVHPRAVVTSADCAGGPLRNAAVSVDGTTFALDSVTTGGKTHPPVWEPVAGSIAVLHTADSIAGTVTLPADAVSDTVPSNGLVLAAGTSFSIESDDVTDSNTRAATGMSKSVRPGTPVLTTAGKIIGVASRGPSGDRVELLRGATYDWIAGLPR